MNKDKYTLSEKEVFILLDKAETVLLYEPPYNRSYIPLGLAKIASYLKLKGKTVYFSRGTCGRKVDLICMTTLFTTDSQIVLREISRCKQSLLLRNTPIIIGGIFASLMPKYIYEKTGIRSFVGCSNILDSYIPDYNRDWQVKGFFKDAGTIFTTRGCPNKCGYCMVWRMEPKFYVVDNWEKQFNIDREVILVSDNNILSVPLKHLDKFVRVVIKNKKKILFNNGLEVKLINKEKAKLLSKIDYTGQGRPGLRLGFDRIKEEEDYRKGVELLLKYMPDNKFKDRSMSYILFGFNDTPQDAFYRASTAWKYKSHPYLMQYRALNQLQKGEIVIGKYWTRNLLRAFKLWGQTYGYNTGDKNFETWMKSDRNKTKIKLIDEDWDKWYYDKNKYKIKV